MSCNSDRVGLARSNADGKSWIIPDPSWKRAACREGCNSLLLEFSCLPGLWNLGTLLWVGGGVVMAKGSLSSWDALGYIGESISILVLVLIKCYSYKVA